MFRLFHLAALLLVLTGAARAEPVWLVSNGFHSSIAVRRKDVPAEVAALVGDPRAEHLVIGWGAAVFYTSPKVTLWTLFQATCLPTASALHVIPVRGPIARRFSHSDVLRFEATRKQMQALGGFLQDAVRRDRGGRPMVLGRGYFAESRFYSGREIFWFPVTCNVWSARALRRAGVRVSPVTSIAASELVWQVRNRGRREQVRRRPLDGF